MKIKESKTENKYWDKQKNGSMTVSILFFKNEKSFLFKTRDTYLTMDIYIRKDFKYLSKKVVQWPFLFYFLKNGKVFLFKIGDTYLTMDIYIRNDKYLGRQKKNCSMTMSILFFKNLEIYPLQNWRYMQPTTDKRRSICCQGVITFE